MSSTDTLSLLRTWGRQQGGELRARLDISRATLMRSLRAAGDQVISRGGARRSAYAAPGPWGGTPAPIALYRIAERGPAHERGLVDLVHPDGSALDRGEPMEWPPLGAEMADGWYDGLP